MNVTEDDLQKAFNIKLVGVNFNFNEVNGDYPQPHEPIRFCEAVKLAQTSGDILLKKEDISCPAARAVLGFEIKDHILMECAEKLVDAKRFKDVDSAFQVLSDVPKIRGSTSSVLLSTSATSPDVYVAYLSPVEAMQILQAHQRVFLQPLRVDITGVAPICGGCAVRSYITNEVCISFGCDDSRTHGGISDNMLALGIPFRKAVTLLRSLKEMKGPEGILPHLAV